MIINVKVRPNSSVEDIVKISDKEYLIHVKEPAEDNRANKKVVNILARELKVNFRKIKIKNPNSREKVFEILED